MSEKFDKAALFQWIQGGAEKLQEGIERGAQKGQAISEAINAKIDAHPTLKTARDKTRDFVREQKERLSDVSIGHTRLGDIPNAAQRLTERQFYKLIDRMRQIDPDFHWDSGMPSPSEMPVFEAFERLGLPYGTPWEEVKKTYRRLMREWHPDKHGESPEAEAQATRRTQEITSAYELIAQHYGK